MIDVSSLGLGLSASGGGVAAPFSAIAADGWQTTVAAPSDLSLTPFTVQRAGYTSAGATTTHSKTMYLTKRVRQAYPNQASFTADQVAVSDYIYSTDTVAGAVNNSTVDSPLPVARWLMPDALMTSTTVTAEIGAWHANGIACVKFRANDGTTQTAWQTVSTTTISTICTDANPVEAYAATIDISSLASGAFWLEAEVYPVIGGASSVLKSEDLNTAGANARELTRRWFKKGSVPAYCYVASTGNDTTGSANAVAATASSTPCLTVAGALKKLHDLLGTSAGALDGARIRVTDGVTMGTTTFTGSYKQDVAAVVIERDPNVSRATANITMAANFAPDFDTSSIGPDEGQLLLREITLTISGARSFQGSSSPSHPLHVQLWDCAIDMASNATNLRSTGYLSYFGGTISNIANNALCPLGLSGSNNIRIIRGITADMNTRSHEGWTTIGCDISRSNGQGYSDLTKGIVFANNRYLSPNGAQSAIMVEAAAAGDLITGIVIVQNEVEWTSATSSPSIAIAASNGSTHHSIVHNNTCSGDQLAGRWNLFYDEHASVARTHTLISFKGDIGTQLNTKGDIFKTDGTRLGNFAFAHGVGCEGNFTIDAANAPSSEAQSYPGIGSIIAGGDPLFTDNQASTFDGSTYSAGAGGGTYTLEAGSDAIGILSGPLLTFDLAGSARGSGVQNAGAYA